MLTNLPPDFRDRPHRWFWNILVALRIRPVKQVCCESFRKEGKMRACKGCATLYDKQSSSWLYRSIARVARTRKPPTQNVPLEHKGE